MAKELFLEIGTEEIPAGFLPKAMAEIATIICGAICASPRIANTAAAAPVSASMLDPLITARSITLSSC